ncbi:MAG: cation transporter, partial [Gammaproteobacteria bacterium]|nr:cation transporter [Gammaproteobacteria bacterium]
NVIMEGVPSHLSLEDVGLRMAANTKVKSVHDLHLWTLSSGTIALSAHIVLQDMSDWERVLNELRDLLHDDFNIEHVTLQPELQSKTETFIPIESLITNE